MRRRTLERAQIKGTHIAMKSGMLAAESAFAATTSTSEEHVKECLFYCRRVL